VEILLVRHAESEGNLRGVMQGQVDYPLSELGRQQAICVADYLQQYHTQKPDFFLASPLSRAYQTAEIIADKLNISTLPTDPLLVEVSSGIFSGLTWSEALVQYPEICLRFKQLRDWSAVPEGESKQDLWARAKLFLENLSQQYAPQARGVVVTHGGFIRAILGVVAGVSPQENLFICIDNTSLSLIGIEDGRKYIRFVNRTQHIEDCGFIPDHIPK
jgi:broad specificity phosphatase PhoE